MHEQRTAVWLLAVCLAGPVMAQNHEAAPLYETLELAGDFMPDPRVVELQAGGSLDASVLGANCVGYINPDNPDVTIAFSNPLRPLNLYVRSDSDTTLVVRLPNGSWLCDDDSEGVNPRVRIAKPVPGHYAVWVGTFNLERFDPAALYVSEREPEWGEAAAEFEPEVAPRFGSHALSAGFAPDPLAIALRAGGPDHAAEFDPACSGRIDGSAPTATFELESELPSLSFYATSEQDTTLAVLTPDGNWLCDDDSHGVNPAVSLSLAPAGRYRIWVGLWDGEDAEATLFATAGAPDWGDAEPGVSELPPVDIAGLSPLAAFERIVAETVPPGGLLWAGAEPSGDAGFVLQDVELHPEPGSDQAPIRISRVQVERLDLQALANRSPPMFLDLAIIGLVAPIDQLDGPEQLTELGIDALNLDAALAYQHDPATRRLTLDRLNLDFRDLTWLELALILDGVDAEVMESFDPEAPGPGLVEARLDYRDAGLLRQLLTTAAAEQGLAVPELIEQSIGNLRAQFAEQGLADDPTALGIFSALESFLRDLPEQSGTLRLRLNPPQPAELADFMALGAEPGEALRVLGVSVDYLPPSP